MADIDRPLSPRGQRAAEAIATAISARGLVPDRILCSPARRTRETLAALRPLIDESRVAFVDRLYNAGGDYRGIIAELGGDAETLMVIGHNPSIHATATALIGGGDRALTAEISAKYPTGALTVIAFETGDWASLSPRAGHVTAFIKPRDLEADRTGPDGDD